MGLCPFHSEKSPSFSVSSEKQLYYCFGCGEGGDAFKYLMKRDGLSFPEAVRQLAKRCGIAIDEAKLPPEARARIRQREGLFRANQLAISFFKAQLEKAPHVSDYLEHRHLTAETLDAFEIGYAPDGWDHLSRFLYENRVPKALAVQSGLLMENDRGGIYDRFRNRVIFPIRDSSSQVAGFGGRVLDDSRPKYLNSPETLVYHKSRILYALPLARPQIRQTACVHVVEGYVDAIALYQAGVRNVVATLGTALTEDHVRLMKGYAKEAVLVFDSDSAGINAAERSIPVFEKQKMDVRILVLPEGQDPDAFVSANGGAAFLKLAERGKPVIHFLSDISIRRHGLSVEGRLHVLDDLKGPVQAIDDGLKRSLYIRDLAERLEVDESAIRSRYEVVRPEIKKSRGETGHDPLPVDWQRKDRMEKRILSMLVQFPDIHPEMRKRETLSLFQDPEMRQLGEAILSGLEAGGKTLVDVVSQHLDPASASAVASLALSEDEWVYDGCVKLLDQFSFMRGRRRRVTGSGHRV